MAKNSIKCLGLAYVCLNSQPKQDAINFAPLVQTSASPEMIAGALQVMLAAERLTGKTTSADMVTRSRTHCFIFNLHCVSLHA